MDALDVDNLTEGAIKGRVIADVFRRCSRRSEITHAGSDLFADRSRESHRIRVSMFQQETWPAGFPTPSASMQGCDIHPYAFTDEAMKEHEDTTTRSTAPRARCSPSVRYWFPGWRTVDGGTLRKADVIGQVCALPTLLL